MDRFALLYRLPNGKTVLDQFLASWPDLSAADRDLLRGWRDPVDGIFEIRGRQGDSLILLNLIDDLEYRTYSNMGPAAFRPLPKHGFVYARLVPVHPVPGAWLVSGPMRAYRKSDAAQVARALELATRLPELARRNPGKVGQAWQQMRADRAAFVECFGRDRAGPSACRGGGADQRFLLAPAGSRARRAARPPAAGHPRRGRARVPASARTRRRCTIGVICDEIDGLNFYSDYGMLRDLSPTRLARPASGTRTSCADTCGRRRSARCRFAAWPPLTRRRSTRCSGRSWASRISAGPSPARPCCAGESPGTRAPSRHHRDRRPPQ